MNARRPGDARTESDESISDSWERLTEQLERLRGDLSEVSTAAADLAKAGAAEGRDRIVSQVEELTARLETLRDEVDKRSRRTVRQAGHQAGVLARDLESSINRNPFAAVMIALGIGLLIGITSRR